MTRGITRRSTRGSIVALAALGILALSACGTQSQVTAPGPAATTAAAQPATDGGTPATDGGTPATPNGKGAAGATDGTGTPGASATAKDSPKTGQGLQDGVHDGYLTKVDTAQRTVTFDKVELLSGQAAREAYQKANPGATDGPDNDYFLVNDNKLLRTLPVSTGVTVSVIDVTKGGGVAPKASSFAKLPAFLAVKDNSTLFSLTVTNGKVTALKSIYLP